MQADLYVLVSICLTFQVNNCCTQGAQKDFTFKCSGREKAPLGCEACSQAMLCVQILTVIAAPGFSWWSAPRVNPGRFASFLQLGGTATISWLTANLVVGNFQNSVVAGTSQAQRAHDFMRHADWQSRFQTTHAAFASVHLGHSRDGSWSLQYSMPRVRTQVADVQATITARFHDDWIGLANSRIQADVRETFRRVILAYIISLPVTSCQLELQHMASGWTAVDAVGIRRVAGMPQ